MVVTIVCRDTINCKDTIVLCNGAQVFDQPPLSQSDYMVSDLVNTVPVGGRLSLFVDHWVKITQDHFIISVVHQGFLISFQNNFPGVLREDTVPPRDPKLM